MRAVVFPVDEAKPNFIWMKVSSLREEIAKLLSFEGDQPLVSELPANYNERLRRHLKHNFNLCYRDEFRRDGSKPTQSLEDICAADRSILYLDWRGSLVAHRADLEDFDLNDFRSLVDLFLTHHTKPLLKDQVPIRAVRINCVGDQKVFGKPKFEQAFLSRDNNIFTIGSTSDVAELIGLPLRICQLPPHPDWENCHRKLGGSVPFVNQAATLLNLNADPEREANESEGVLPLGWAPMWWQNNIGSVVVVRQDKKDLHPWHIKALSRYCEEEALSILTHDPREPEIHPPMTKQQAVAMICRPAERLPWIHATHLMASSVGGEVSKEGHDSDDEQEDQS